MIPSAIGSGPTVADPSLVRGRARNPRQTRDRRSRPVRAFLARGANGQEPETIKPGDPRLSRARLRGHRQPHSRRSNGAQLAAAARWLRSRGHREPTHGEVPEASHQFVTEARQRAAAGPRPLCCARCRRDDSPGRRQGSRRPQSGVCAGRSGGDGIGRASRIARQHRHRRHRRPHRCRRARIVDSTTVIRAERAGLDAQASLADNDAYHFFEPLGDLIRLGRTGTNVGDLHVMLIA